MPLTIGGTHAVTQALIPASSFSQALFPASACLPPALFPILDADGLLKPAILILVEEALAAGKRTSNLHRAFLEPSSSFG